MKRINLITLFLVVIILLTFPYIVFAGDSNALKQRLAYLKDIPEISWVEFDDNNVYIGFIKPPPDLRVIINGAAAHGNRAYGRGVHIWAVEAKYKHWRPGDGPFYCSATARYGKLEKPCK